MRNFWKKHNVKIIALCIFVVFLLGLVSVIAILGGTVMKFFGFEYQSVGSIILFFLLASVLSFPAELVSEALPKVLYDLGRLSKGYAVALYLVLDTLVSFFAFSAVDFFMDSVSASEQAILAVSFLLALWTVKDNFEEKEKNNKKEEE